MRALIVDDNPHFREIFKIVFRNKFPSWTVEEAGNSEEALQMVHGMSPHLIFLDILLSGENGLQLAQKMKKDFPNIRIAMLTNNDLPKNRRAAASFGAERFFVKDSLNWEEMREYLASILEDPEKK